MADWNKMAENYKNKYKDFAPEGRYAAKIDSIEVHEVGSNGSIAQDFKFMDGEVYAFPKATHWLSFKNDDWRMWHNKCLFELLGLSEDIAKKTVESCEKGSKDATVKAYAAAYEKLATKHPEVNIDVWQEGKYARAEFADSSVRMSSKDDDKKSNPLEGSEEIVIEEDELPFD